MGYYKCTSKPPHLQVSPVKTTFKGRAGKEFFCPFFGRCCGEGGFFRTICIWVFLLWDRDFVIGTILCIVGGSPAAWPLTPTASRRGCEQGTPLIGSSPIPALCAVLGTRLRSAARGFGRKKSVEQTAGIRSTLLFCFARGGRRGLRRALPRPARALPWTRQGT